MEIRLTTEALGPVVTARSTSAGELLSPSPAQPALHLRLRQWKALKKKRRGAPRDGEGECAGCDRL